MNQEPGPVATPDDREDGVGLALRRVRELVKGQPVTCGAGETVAEAARLMTERRVGSVVVIGGDGAPLGIVTDRDLRARVLAAGLPPATATATIMSSPLISIGPGRSALDALLDMTRQNLHHLAVMEEGRLVGVISSHDLMLLQGAHPVALTRGIEEARSLDGLASLGREFPTLIKRLADGGAPAVGIGRIVAELNDRLLRRVVGLSEAGVEGEGHGRPPVAYSWIAAGSEGRREQTLRTDQDNGLVYDDAPGELAAAGAAYFSRLASAVGVGLMQIGFPPCDGGFMASNPRWCQPVSVWRDYFRGWMVNPHPERLLQASVYCDLRPVAGDEGPGLALGAWLRDEAPRQTLFLRHMARSAAEWTPPLGFFGQITVERSGEDKGTVDLKRRGVLPMIQAMRVYALALGIPETNTIERLVRAGTHEAFTPPQVRELADAYEVISRLRLGRQLQCLEAARPPDNLVRPADLGKTDRLVLREAFRSLQWLQRLLEDRFQTAGVD